MSKKRAPGKRINLERAEEIADRKVATLAVACPFGRQQEIFFSIS